MQVGLGLTPYLQPLALGNPYPPRRTSGLRCDAVLPLVLQECPPRLRKAGVLRGRRGRACVCVVLYCIRLELELTAGASCLLMA